MRLWLVRAAAFIAVAAAFVSAPQLTRAQTTPVSALDKGIASPVDSMLHEALASRKAEHNARKADPNAVAAAATSAPASPAQFQDSLETPRPGILYPSSPGIHFTADVSSAFAEGNTGARKNNLPGGQDISIFLGPDKYTRLLVGYYTVQQYPVGFDQGLVPTYLQTAALPGGSILVPKYGPRIPCNNTLVQQTATQTGNPVPQILCGTNPYNNGQADEYQVQQDASVNQKVMIAALSRLIWFGLPLFGGGGYLPIVITPNYVATKTFIAGHADTYLAYNPNNGTYQTVHLRSSEQKGFLLTVPFADSARFFATYNIGPQWLVNTNGFNQDNHAQFIQYMDIRYFATKKDTIFFQPSRLPLYFPTDYYPERVITYIYGFNHSFAKGIFFQGLITSGFPQNPQYGHTGRLGAIDATCVVFPDCINLKKVNFQTNTAVTYGSERATTFQLQFGIGTPSAIPI
jgi:hypothetical protein